MAVHRLLHLICTLGIFSCSVVAPTIPVLGADTSHSSSREWLKWQPLPPLPDSIGIAGPFVGNHNGNLIVAGGANFAAPNAPDLWETSKKYFESAYVLTEPTHGNFSWKQGFSIERPLAYGACVSIPEGVICAGGEDGHQAYKNVFILAWDTNSKALIQRALPPLPSASTGGGAAVCGDYLYVVCGQREPVLKSACDVIWRLDVSQLETNNVAWETLPPVPGGPRAFSLVVSQHNGFEECLYVLGGRRQNPNRSGAAGIEPLSDFHEFSPTRFAQDPTTAWRQRSDAPTPLMAGTAVAVGQSHIMVLAAADGSLLKNIAADPNFEKHHPGFPKRSWAYHTITNTWTNAGTPPACPVTTPAVNFDDGIAIISGEIRPRVRTPAAWHITLVPHQTQFHPIDYVVLLVYLITMIAVGLYFMRQTHNTDDFFRGGQQMRWWAAGCSIFATMLSSITFMAIPAKAFAQDWVYALGNLMIVVVAPVAVFMALPFFRRIDATSAYEYLELRFSRAVRLSASGLFTVFHIFRMAIVMSLASLALAVVTPLSPTQSVLLLGVLSIMYCALGGVEAVIWTDTIQTAVLLGGAIVCLVIMVTGSDGGIFAFISKALADGKLHNANLHFDPAATNIALWVIIAGGLGQNFSSYISDQSVVQRYMTTPDKHRAATSIWLAAGLAAIATILFFSLGTGLYVFYSSHPNRLDPTFTTDQIFPLFILHEIPTGIAGLIVAGIFAAAQSTISTSMNSTATAIVTDYLKPLRIYRSEKSYLRVARLLTIACGLLGTVLALTFIDPRIYSLFDSSIKIIGIFMGVLGGLFALGMLTRRSSSTCALLGVLAGACTMFMLPLVSNINGYLYPALGISTSFLVGVCASFIFPHTKKDLHGLTVFTETSQHD